MTTKEFMQLCKDGTHQQIKAAIEAGMDVNVRDGRKKTPLMFAIRNKAVGFEILNVLVEAVANV